MLLDFTSKYTKLIVPDIPGHGLSIQSCDSDEFPVQFDPPFTGSGELQSLVRVCAPFPHVTLHAACALQFDHAPSTIVLHINTDRKYF